ncbi:MAG: AAA family ATPase, partial [Clostridiales bacterium]|nr:AAA family ATPase [Clostridiales bacterium]
MTNAYIVDKSLFIKDFMTRMGQANLIARPGLFGKSFNMGMLKSYLEIGADPALFKGLAIEGETEIYDRHFGKYAVLHLELAQVNGDSFEECLMELSLCLKGLFEGELKYLLKSDRLSTVNKRNLARIS